MKKAKLMALVGKRVRVTLFDTDTTGTIEGKLFFVDEISAKHGYRKPNYFYVDTSNWMFKVSHVKNVEVLE